MDPRGLLKTPPAERSLLQKSAVELDGHAFGLFRAPRASCRLVEFTDQSFHRSSPRSIEGRGIGLRERADRDKFDHRGQLNVRLVTSGWLKVN